MASGMIAGPVMIFYKDYTTQVSISVGVNNISDVTVTVNGYTPISWIIQSGDNVTLRNACTLLGINRSMHPQVYSSVETSGSMTFRIYYMLNSKLTEM